MHCVLIHCFTLHLALTYLCLIRSKTDEFNFRTRYPNLNPRLLRVEQVRHLYDCGDQSYEDGILDLPAKRLRTGTSKFINYNLHSAVMSFWLFSQFDKLPKFCCFWTCLAVLSNGPTLL
jgi:hypothetical protein